MTSLINGLKQLALEAGVVIMEIYADESRFGVESKADDSPLTLADKESNRVICDGLQKLTPSIPIISEENKEIDYAERKAYDYAWLVDPVDGTKEFIKRNGEFTVNIALILNGAPVLGVVYVPATKALYWASRKEGAFLSTDGGAPVKLKASSFSMKDKGLKVVCSRSHLNDDTAAFIDKLDQPEKVSKGSSLKFLILAEGGAQVYPRLAPTMEWDTGAAQIILEEAGGKVIDVETGLPLAYNKKQLRNPHFIAYGHLQGESL